MKSPLNRGGLRFYLVFIALLAGIGLFHTSSPRSILAGLPFLFLGVCLHTWAKGCLRQNRVVATIGPYRFLRHPFYLANALIDLGIAVMAGWLPLAIALPFWWLAIYIPVIRGEERYLSEKFRDEYPVYRKRVPCLLPWRVPLPYSGDGFRWSNPNIVGGEELPRAARILAYPLLFLVAQGIAAEGSKWPKSGWSLTALIGLMMLYALAWQLHLHQRQRRRILPLLMQHPILRVAIGWAVLAAVYYLTGPKTIFRNFMPIGGALLLLLSVPVFSRRPARALLAEMLVLLGVVAAGELVWLAPAVVVIYAAWLLDRQLTDADSLDVSGERLSPAPFWPYFYPLLAIAAAAVIGVKLVGHVLPYHIAWL